MCNQRWSEQHAGGFYYRPQTMLIVKRQIGPAADAKGATNASPLHSQYEKNTCRKNCLRDFQVSITFNSFFYVQ